MSKKYTGIIYFFAGVLLTVLLLSQFSFKNNPSPKANIYQWQSPMFPKELSFAGEKVPLERWDVKERLERQLLINYYNQANIIFLLKTAHRYFPVISERLKANEVPDDFKYLCVAESNLVSSALSKAGAVSYWQFMNYTGPGYNLEINSEVDQRYDIVKATDAACKYLKQAHEKLGNWTAAAASYNCGQGGYNAQATFQQTYNYYDLSLPEETNHYIYRILAFKQLLENADSYGFPISDEEKYNEIPYRTVTITSTIPNLAQYALSNGTTYKILRLMNPWIRGKTLPVRVGSSYDIKLPK